MVESPRLIAPDEAELIRLARVVERLLAGRPRILPGNRPHRMRAGRGIEFLDHRDYQPGDNLRDIDWRASARRTRHQIRRYRNEASADWFICLDHSASMGLNMRAKWRLGAELAAAFAFLLIHLDNRVGLILFSHRVDAVKPLGRGQRSYTDIWRMLESNLPLGAGGGSSLTECAGRVPTGSQIMVISDFLAPESMGSELALLARIGESVHALQITDEFDVRFTGEEGQTLFDVESGERIDYQPAAGNAEQVKQRRQALTDELEMQCRRFRIPFSRCDTARSWKDLLLQHMVKRG